MKLRQLLTRCLSAAPLCIFTPFAWSAPFSSCPTQAFLVQQSTAQLFGVNLATGFYQSLSTDMGTDGKLNAMGFNFHDDYLYAWGYEFNTLVRIGADYQVEPLALSGPLSAGVNFFVGDVAVSENAYYLYRRGAADGLYRVALAPDAPDYLDAQRIVDGAALDLQIYDFAFHPSNGQLYSVDARGILWQIDPHSGQAQSRGQIGQSGTFGAVYFDVDGLLYISRNADGLIYQIDVAEPQPQALLFAQGPASSNNDGARCAIAPIVDADSANIDYGDAPDSYGTVLASNGARHELVAGGVRLGSRVDGEQDAARYPASDDMTAPVDDEDGITFVTGVQAGLDLVIEVEASATGLLSGWIDFDGDGSFDADEQVLADLPVSAGRIFQLLSVPASAKAGDSWARFRISSAAGLQPTGGAPDGEVEDYPILISEYGTQISVYPSVGDYATIAFEDNWPAAGDYDLNDVVVAMQTRILADLEGQLQRVEIHGWVQALGASYRNGLAVRLPGIASSLIDESLVRFEINGNTVAGPLLDPAQSEAVAVISTDMRDYLNPNGECDFYRTQTDCHGSGALQFTLYLPFVAGVDSALLPAAPFDPFIFAGPGQRLPLFAKSPGAQLEIHLKHQAPSPRHDNGLWGSADDSSTPLAGLYYQSTQGLPWALLIPVLWQHPLERIDVAAAYPKLIEFSVSEGARAQDWYLPAHAVAHLLYQE